MIDRKTEAGHAAQRDAGEAGALDAKMIEKTDRMTDEIVHGEWFPTARVALILSISDNEVVLLLVNLFPAISTTRPRMMN